jgi:hypothetical protein
VIESLKFETRSFLPAVGLSKRGALEFCFPRPLPVPGSPMFLSPVYWFRPVGLKGACSCLLVPVALTCFFSVVLGLWASLGPPALAPKPLGLILWARPLALTAGATTLRTPVLLRGPLLTGKRGAGRRGGFCLEIFREAAATVCCLNLFALGLGEFYEWSWADSKKHT